MKKKSFIEAEKIFKQNNGILRAAQAKSLGIHAPILVQMVEEELLVKEGRGLYRLADLSPLTNPDLIQVSSRVPNGVVCLISALNFHNLTAQIPHWVYLALPQNTKAPQIDYPPLEIVYLSSKPFLAGIEHHALDGINVKIYNKEKTVTDCFKFRNKIGLDIAVEALRDYFRQPNYDLPELQKYAQINRVYKIMEPYIRALL